MPNSTNNPVTVPPSEALGGGAGMPSDSFGLAGSDVIEPAGTPQLTPPSEVATAADEGITAWLTNRKILRLWTNSANKNSWINIQGIGWKRFFTGSESAVVCMTMLAAHARAGGRNVNVRLEADDLVHEIYVW